MGQNVFFLNIFLFIVGTQSYFVILVSGVQYSGSAFFVFIKLNVLGMTLVNRII